MRKLTMKKLILTATAAVLVFGAGLMLGANRFGKPQSIVHIVTVKWKEGTTPAQTMAAL